MDWLANLQLHEAAKRYALCLPKYLKDKYLDSDFYTRAQIDHAVEALNLPRDHIGLAYAAYFSRNAYDEARAALRLPMSYEDARNEFFQHIPKPEPTAEWNPLSSTILGRL